MERSIAAVFVLCESGTRTIMGYYTLSAYGLVPTGLPPHVAKKLPRYDRLPATLLGRLAVDERFGGQGVGRLLLFDALQRSFTQTTQIGSLAVIVDATDEKARAFYEHFGFQLLADHPNRLFIPMKTVAEAVRLGAGR